MCDCNPYGLDLKIPRNEYLTAFYKRSFAHYTVKHRMPVILTQTIDGLVRTKEDIGHEYGEKGLEDLKMAIGELSKLKYEIQTNKPITQLISNAFDVKFYNNYISGQADNQGRVTFFSAVWLLSECYMYRRIRQAFELTKTLQNYDPFSKQKQDSYFHALPLMTSLAQHLAILVDKTAQPIKEEFISLLKINLWGNKCDLSLSNGKVGLNIDEIFSLDDLKPNILCDHSEQIWTALTRNDTSSDIVDIVLDNSGYEIFTDLCVADYLMSKELAKKIRFYVKTIPWFISDVTTPDFHWTLDQLENNENDSLKKLAEKWKKYVINKKWTIVESDFWTLPVDFTYMAKTDPVLYKKLAESNLIIFKGDLNYRKLFGERNWDPVTPIDEALQNFNPAKLCSLRTIKSDIVCGLPEGVAEKLDETNKKWMETGNYGLIQFSEKIVLI